MTSNRLSPHGFSEAQIDALSREFNASLLDLPLRRGEAVFIIPGESPRRSLQHELAAELRTAGLSSLARRIERALVAVGHVLVVAAGADVRVFLIRIVGPNDVGCRDQGPSSLVSCEASDVVRAHERLRT